MSPDLEAEAVMAARLASMARSRSTMAWAGMTGWVRKPLIAAAAIACLLAATSPADGSQQVGSGPAPQASRGEVFAALGVDTVKADYVVIVDTSGSMREGNLYGQVVSSLGPLLAAVAETDHLSLLTFDTTPAIRYSGLVGSPSDRALGQLPSDARGEATDIGSAIDAGIQELERPDASSVGSLLLITDGRHDPPSGSGYQSTTGASWDALARRGAAVKSARGITSYALALIPDTDAALLNSVLPGTSVVALPADQLGPFLERVKEETRIQKARSLLSGDLPVRIDVSWDSSSLNDLDLNEGRGSTELVLTSRSKSIPVRLRDLRVVAAEGFSVDVAGLPDDVVLGPGESRTIRVQLRFPTAGGFGLGRSDVTRSGSVSLAAAVESPWQEVLRGDLGLPYEADVEQNSAPLRGRGQEGYGWPTLVLIATPFLLGLLFLGFLLVNRHPKLRGTVTATPSGQPSQKVQLGGRVVPIGTTRGSRLSIPGKGRIVGKRVTRKTGRGHDIDLLIEYSANGAKPRPRICHPNSSTQVDGVTFSYRT